MGMTVAKLREKLKDMPQDAEVATEGCDCYGDVGRVEVETVTDRKKSYQIVTLFRS